MKKVLLSIFGLSAALISAQTWSTQNSNFPTTGAFPIAFSVVDANTVWAFTTNATGGVTGLQEFTRTSNGGTNWTGGNIGLGNTSLLISDLAAANGTTAWVAAVNTSGGANDGIWKTTDGGTVWTKQATATYGLTSSFPNVVHFFDANNGVTQGDPDSSGAFEIYTTSNGGTTWTRVPAANIPNATNEFGYVHIAEAAGNTIWFGTDLGRIFKSNDKGLTWSVVQSPVIDFGGVTTAGASGELTVKDANTGWVMDQDGIVSATTDGGLNWEPLATVGTVYTSDIMYVPGTANTLISGGASADSRGSSISLDGGLNWTDLTPATGDPNGITTIGAVSASAVWGGGFSNGATGGMSKLSPLMATVNPKLAANKVVAYPNPTKGEVNLESKSSIKSIELMDMSGKLVKTFGSITQLDLTGMKSGMYILNVTLADGQKTSTKLIKN